MIPTLYAENETQFATNGLGRLTDVISCVTAQNTEGKYELSMEYPLNGIHADDISANRIIYAVSERGKEEQPFRIRNIEKTLNGRMKVTARHICYDLAYYACKQFGQVEELPYQEALILYNSSQNKIGELTAVEKLMIGFNGTEWTMSFAYPSGGQYYSQISVGCYVNAQPEPNRELKMFRITEITLGDGEKRVQATADSTVPTPPIYNNLTVSEALSALSDNTAEIQTCPFTFSAQPTTTGDEWATDKQEYWIETPRPVRSMLQGSDDSIATVYGGEWEFDHYSCILHESRGADNGVTYRYGKNITQISERINIDDIYTHAFSYWKGTASSSTDTSQGEYYVRTGNVLSILNSRYSDMFPTQRTLIIDASSEFESRPSVSQLNKYTRKFVKENGCGTPTVTIDVSIIDLSATRDYVDIADLEQVNLYDTVTVVFPRFGIDIKSRISSIEFDVLREINNKVTIGSVTTNLSDIIAGNKRDIVRTKNALRKWADRAIERATEAISGWNGGNIRSNYNKNDHKQQSMYIMDTDDVDSASKSVSFSRNGIGVSSNGARGDYDYMVDFSSEKPSFSDKFAENGDTNGSFLKRGIITSSADNYWDLEQDIVAFKLASLNVDGDAVISGTLLLGRNMLDVEAKLDAMQATLDDHETRISDLEA